MKGKTLRNFTLLTLLILLLVGGGGAFDPCWNNAILESRWRFDDVDNIFEWKVSDFDLKETWYKFGKCGLRMPETCIQWKTCGSEFPIWLNGTHPTNNGQAKAQACSSMGSRNCCKWKREIEVKHCQSNEGHFYVYRLKPTDHYMSYCVRSLTVCKNMEYYNESTSSCLPMANETFPNPVISKTLLEEIKTIILEGRQFKVTTYSLECVVDLSSSSMELKHQVDEIEIKFSEGNNLICPSTSVCKHYLKERFLLRRYDQEFTCMARYRLKSHPCNEDPQGYTEWYSSSPFKHNIRLLTKDGSTVDRIDLYENTAKQFRLISNFPMTSLFCFYAPTMCKATVDFKVFAKKFFVYDDCVITFEKDGGFLSEPFYIKPENERLNERMQSWLNLTILYDQSSPYVFPPDFKLSFAIWSHSIRRSYCLSSFDHSIITLKGEALELDADGDFELLNDDSVFKVQIRQTRCSENQNLSYVCAVAMKDYEEVLVVSLCGGFNVPRFARILSSGMVDSRWGERFSDFEILYENGAYKIRFESGNIVIISTRNMHSFTSLNVHIVPMSGEKYRGLCEDGGRAIRRLSETTSLFTMDLRKVECVERFPRDLFCFCGSYTFLDEPSSDVICYLRDNLNFHSISMCSSGNRCQHRSYQYLHNGYEPKCDQWDVLPEQPLYNQEVLVAPLKTFHKFQEACLALLNRSSVFEICINEVEEHKVKFLLDGCSNDFEKDGFVDAEQVIALFEEICFIELSYTRRKQSEHMATIKSSICPKACSGKGACKNGVCICSKDYSGADCSVVKNSVPDIEQILPDHCDASESEICSNVFLYANNIDQDERFMCRLHPVGICKGHLSHVQLSEGLVISPGRVRCRFPELEIEDLNLFMAQISLSNNGIDFGTSVPYTIYNGSCFHCTSAAECSFVKTFQQKRCLKGRTKCLPSNGTTSCIPKLC